MELLYKKPGVSKIVAEKRVERAEQQLKTHGNSKDWKRVLFTDEVYFGWSDEGRLHIKLRTGSRCEP